MGRRENEKSYVETEKQKTGKQSSLDLVGISVEAKRLALCKNDDVVTGRPDWSVTCCLPAAIGRARQRVTTARGGQVHRRLVYDGPTSKMDILVYV